MDMSEQWHREAHANREKWFLGHREAINFIAGFFNAVELWDDLIDKDTEIATEHVNSAFLFLMFELPSNSWFVANRAYYLPTIMASINAFHDANEMCNSSSERLRQLAFHIRNMGIELYISTALLLGGYSHMRAVSQEIREFFAFESFDEWEV